MSLLSLLFVSTLEAADGAAATATYGGHLQPDSGTPLAVNEQLVAGPGEGWSLQRRVVDADARTRYASTLELGEQRASWRVETGHPAQQVSYEFTPGQVVARGPDGAERWRAPLRQPLCLPELVAELAVQLDRQVRTRAGLACELPIDKARKLAPLRLRRLPDGAGGLRRYELGPGSLGMRLFFSRQILSVTADGGQLIAAEGQFEVARSLEGRLRYLEGALVYVEPRSLRALPAVLTGPHPPATGSDER